MLSTFPHGDNFPSQLLRPCPAVTPLVALHRPERDEDAQPGRKDRASDRTDE